MADISDCIQQLSAQILHIALSEHRIQHLCHQAGQIIFDPRIIQHLEHRPQHVEHHTVSDLHRKLTFLHVFLKYGLCDSQRFPRISLFHTVDELCLLINRIIIPIPL